MLKSDEGQTVSIWEATGDAPAESSLSNDIETHVCVVGAGIAGLTTAYLLAKAGEKVIVIDDGVIGGGESGRTTGHLSNAIDDRFYELEKLHGEEKSRLAAQSHAAAIDFIERTSESEQIDCDFSRLDGYLFEPPDGDQSELDQEFEAARRSGASVEFADRAPINDFNTGRAIKFARQGQFHILKYLKGLAEKIEQNGGQLFSHTKAFDWTGGENPTVEIADGKKIRARAVVLATNYPLKSGLHFKQAPYRTYVIGVRAPKGFVTKALYWDTNDPYNYTRLQEENDYDVIITGGEDHLVGHVDDADARYNRLEEWTRTRFPAAQDVMFRWSGEVQEPHDYLAFIGRWSTSEPNIYLASGDSGMGMTHGTIAGILISDLIRGRQNPWKELYDPSRVSTLSITDTIKENVESNIAITDWVTAGGEVEKAEDLHNGQAAIISRGLAKIAAYRDDAGELHERSAVCTHLGCIVRWNSGEKSWDCPCHGSRFGIDGHVINSPAITPLASIEK